MRVGKVLSNSAIRQYTNFIEELVKKITHMVENFLLQNFVRDVYIFNVIM